MSPNLGTVVHRAGQLGPVNGSNGGNRQELWRTPNSQLIEAKPDGIKLTNRTPKDPQVGLADQIRAWATPTVAETHNQNTSSQIYLQNQVGATKKLWATARAGMARGNNFTYDRGKGNIEEQVGASVSGGGKLNPRWVETLMGIPVGWTMPSCVFPVTIGPMNSGFLEMASSQPQQP